MKKSIKKIQQWKKSRRKQANKQTNKKAKNQKKGGKEVFWLTIEGANRVNIVDWKHLTFEKEELNQRIKSGQNMSMLIQ